MRFNLLLEVLCPEKSSIVWTEAVQREPVPKQDKNKKTCVCFNYNNEKKRKATKVAAGVSPED